MKKLGATPSDRAYIKRRASAGISAEDISNECNVIVEVVTKFMPGYEHGRGGDSKAGTAKKTKASRAKAKTELESPQEPDESEAKVEVETATPEVVQPPSRKRSA